MSAFHEKDGVLYAEDVPLNQIAEQFGTPTYVYSAAAIRSQYEALSGAMASVMPADKQPLLCYACKANSNVAVLSYLNKLGSGLEIVSEGELLRGLKAGFDPQKIVSTGVGKQRSEVIACLETGILQLNVESVPELLFINEVAASIGKTAQVVFRLNPDVSGGGHHKISTGRKRDKFGISRERVFEAYKLCQDMTNVEAIGLSMHIGSQVFNVETFKTAFEKLPVLVADLRAEGYRVEHLDIGGGFPIQYQDEKLLDLSAYAEWVRDIIMPLDAKIILEPGRFLVGNAGILLSRSVFIKESSDRTFLILDAAMNDLMRPALYDAYHNIEAVENRDRPQKTYDVVGPVCETGDTFGHERNISEMNAGELAVIKSAGAYGFCMASNYNTRRLPAEVFVNEDQAALIRQRQDYQDIIEKDVIPGWLSD